MTPEEVVAKIMANPEVAVAFQNPKIQTAIMDVSSVQTLLDCIVIWKLGFMPLQSLCC